MTASMDGTKSDSTPNALKFISIFTISSELTVDLGPQPANVDNKINNNDTNDSRLIFNACSIFFDIRM